MAALTLNVRGLRVRYGSREVVGGIDLQLAAGEALGLIGASGSGKSQTARALIGLSDPGAHVSFAHARLGDTDLARVRNWRAVRGRRIGLVLQDALSALDAARTVGAELATAITAHAPRLAPSAVRERATQLLERVGLGEWALPRRAAQLSGGQRQRALIASAIAHSPELLIADEPTTALDAASRRELLALLRGLCEQGMSILLISHDLASVQALCDRVAVIDAGRIVETGPTAAILTAPTSPQARDLVAALPRPPAPRAPLRTPVLLRATGLRRTYRDVVALDVPSLDVYRGETLGVVGASGAGKSTLARQLLALDAPGQDARITLAGQPWVPLPERARRPRRHLVGVVPQNPLATFDPRRTVGAILVDALTHGRARRGHDTEVAAALTEVGLDVGLRTAYPPRLSGGERQRLAIARALAAGCELLICDEAVSALDATIRRQVLDLLARVRAERGLTVVFISHDLEVIGEICDRVAVLDAGRIVEVAGAAELFAHPASPAARRLLGR